MSGARWTSEPSGCRQPGGAERPPADGELLASPDGSVAFRLARSGRGLFVQRTQRSTPGLIAIQCLLISDAEEFRRWCDAEPIRFEHPVVFDRLRRYGDEVLALGG